MFLKSFEEKYKIKVNVKECLFLDDQIKVSLDGVEATEEDFRRKMRIFYSSAFKKSLQFAFLVDVFTEKEIGQYRYEYMFNPNHHCWVVKIDDFCDVLYDFWKEYEIVIELFNLSIYIRRLIQGEDIDFNSPIPAIDTSDMIILTAWPKSFAEINIKINKEKEYEQRRSENDSDKNVSVDASGRYSTSYQTDTSYWPGPPEKTDPFCGEIQ